MGDRRARGTERRLPRLTRRVRRHSGIAPHPGGGAGGHRRGLGAGVPTARDRDRHRDPAAGQLRRARRTGADARGADLRRAGPARGRGGFAGRVRAGALRRLGEERGRRARKRRARPRSGGAARAGGGPAPERPPPSPRGTCPRPRPRPPRIGEAVFGRIVTGVHPRAVTVPVEALVPGGGDAFQVFVVDSGGIAHARPVTVGARTESLAEILAGLAAGETVVTAGAYGIQDSAKIVRVAR